MSAERYLQTVDLYREGKHACMEIEGLEDGMHAVLYGLTSRCETLTPSPTSHTKSKA